MSLQKYAHLGRAAEALSRAIRSGMVSHAYLVEGDLTVDKAGFARAFAKALLCQEMPGEGCDHCLTCRRIDSGNYEDLYLLAPETARGGKVYSIRDQRVEELCENLKMRPGAGERNVAIISGADSMTPRAQNRFLKTLEEPPEGTVILLLSENVETLLSTIRSRCVTLRVGDYSLQGETEMDAFAEEVLAMVARKAFFHDIKSALDKKLKDRAEGGAFLDALEAALSRQMRSGGGIISRSVLAEAVALVEQAKREIRLNVSYKYAIRNLILQLEEY